MMIFLGDYVKILNKERYEGEYGKVEAYDGFMYYTIKLLETHKTTYCEKNQIEKISREVIQSLIEKNKNNLRRKKDIQKEKIIKIARHFTPGISKKYALININPENWETCMEFNVFGIPDHGWSGEIGCILLVRKSGTSNYGVMGIWYINLIEYAKRPFYWEGEWKYNLYMTPIVQFEEPFSEDLARERDESGNLRGLFSRKVDGLKGMPHLQGSIFPLTSSEKSKYVLWNYLTEILKEKKVECNFGDFEYKHPVDDDLVQNFKENLERYIDTVFMEN